MLPITDRRLATAVSVAVLGAVLAPVRQNWRTDPRDGFPLSYYPMFSRQRRAVHREHHVVGVHADGRRTPLPHGWVGPGGGNQVRKQVNRAVRSGRAAELARAVGAGIASRGRGDFVAVEVLTSRYHLDDYFAGRKEPRRREVRGSATVPGGTP